MGKMGYSALGIKVRRGAKIFVSKYSHVIYH